jgi:DNA-binding ferritin-like protein
MNTTHLIAFVAANANLQLAHWAAPSCTNEHATLGALYSTMTELTDDLAEMVLGKAGSRELPSATVQLRPPTSHADMLAEMLMVVAAARAEITDPADEDLANTLADMAAALNKARYLLQV